MKGDKDCAIKLIESDVEQKAFFREVRADELKFVSALA